MILLFLFLSDKVFEKIAEDFMKNNKMQASGMWFITVKSN